MKMKKILILTGYNRDELGSTGSIRSYATPSSGNKAGMDGSLKMDNKKIEAKIDWHIKSVKDKR